MVFGLWCVCVYIYAYLSLGRGSRKLGSGLSTFSRMLILFLSQPGCCFSEVSTSQFPQVFRPEIRESVCTGTAEEQEGKVYSVSAAGRGGISHPHSSMPKRGGGYSTSVGR